MRDYLNLKVTEYSILLDWIEHEMESLRAKNKNRSYLIQDLQNKIEELHELYRYLQVIALIKNPRLISRALPIIHDIEYQIIILTYRYIPALQRENTNDIILRNVLLLAAKRSGLSWIEDIVVRLDNAHAIFPVLTEIPIISAPPQQSVSLSNMSALYHELGHDVFLRFNEIADNLFAIVSIHYSEFKQSVGPMNPEKSEERSRVIEAASKYWGLLRLDEIFCDIYATFICGPAYYFDCMDMALKTKGNPFYINDADVHPPLAARVYVCLKTLLPIHQNDEVAILTQNTWDTYTKTQKKNTDYDIICANALLDQFVEVSIQKIKQLLPKVNRFDKQLQSGSKLREILPSEPLENILNKGIKILLTEAEYYSEWEKNVFIILNKENVMVNQ